MMTTAELFEEIAGEGSRRHEATGARVRFEVRVHPATFTAIAKDVNAKIEYDPPPEVESPPDGRNQLIRLHVGGYGIALLIADPTVEVEGHLRFEDVAPPPTFAGSRIPLCCGERMRIADLTDEIVCGVCRRRVSGIEVYAAARGGAPAPAALDPLDLQDEP